MSAQVSLMPLRPTTESRSANTVVRLVPDVPRFDKVGALLAAECWLLLEAPECRSNLRPSEAGHRRGVLLRETHFSDRRVLAINVDAELGLISCVWDRIDQTASSPTPSEEAQGFGLIPVDSVGEAVRVVSEVAGQEKIGVNEVEGTFNKDMTNDGMIFEAHKQIVMP